MTEKTGGTTPHEQTPACARAEELVAFLYGETGPAEAQDFCLHLNDCAHCREELAAFGEVRARVGEWRAVALGEAPALGLSGAFTAEAPFPSSSPPRARSARAALREFFSLAPLWLRAGAAAALLLVCGLTALTLARTRISWGPEGFAFTAGVPERVVTRVETVEAPAPAGADEARVEALVRERVRAELGAAERRRQEQAEAARQSKPAPRLEQAAAVPPRKRAAPRAAQRGRRAAEDEESLPRLSDLLRGVY